MPTPNLTRIVNAVKKLEKVEKLEKLDSGLYKFLGYDIEKMGPQQWNIRPAGTDTWTDAANTLGEAKIMIKRWEKTATEEAARKEPKQQMDFADVVKASKIEVEEQAAEDITIEAPKMESKVMPHQTEMPTSNLTDMKNLPEYWAEHKGKKFKEVLMTPDEYMQAVADGFGFTKQQMIDDTTPKLVEEYSSAMIRGDKFPKLVLDYAGYFSQEGRHRSLAAKRAGFEKVPVVVIESTK